MYPIKVEIKEQNVLKLREIYKQAYRDIVSEIDGASSFSVKNRKAILKQVETILTDLGENTADFLQKEFPDLYQQGLKDADKQLENVNADLPIKTSMNNIHTSAVEALVDDTIGSFGDAINTVARKADLLLGKVARETYTQTLATGLVAGEARKQTSALIKSLLESQGLAALTDKSGKNWSLDAYAEMLVRTKAVEVRNRGMVNRMVEQGYDLVQVSDHFGECAKCQPWEGRILSATGETKGYPTVAEAEAAGLFHPNCRHALNALIPSLARKTKAYEASQDTVVLGNEEIRKAAGIKKIQPAQPKPEEKLVEAGKNNLLIHAPTSTDPIIKANEGMRYNATFQVSGAQKFGRSEITDEIIKKMDSVDVSKAKNPLEAADLMIKALPSSTPDLVINTIHQWASTMMNAMVDKGVGGQVVAAQQAQQVYRAIGSGAGKGQALLGKGKYFAFSKDNVKQYGDTIEVYSLSPGAKMLKLDNTAAWSRFVDEAVKTYKDEYKKELIANGGDSAIGLVVRKHAQALGFDGIIGEDATFGSVVFDAAKLVLKYTTKL